MKNLITGILACAVVAVVENSCAAAPQPPTPEPVPSVELPIQPPALDLKQIEAAGRLRQDQAAELGNVTIMRFVPTLDYDKEIAGLPKASGPAVLSWERIYALARMRAGSGHGGQGAADFTQFRKDFCAKAPGPGERFHDPSAAVLDLMGRLEAIDNARRNIEFHENLANLLKELIQGQSWSLHQLDVDIVAGSMGRARQKRAEEIGRFRDGLDELKVVLGLSPRVEFILQRPSPAAFREVRDRIDNWQRRPDRSLEELPTILERLPALGEVVVDGQPILGKLDESPDMLEQILTRTAMLAIKNRNDTDKRQVPANSSDQFELRVRRRLRKLFETKRAYEAEKRGYELAIRVRDQTFERLLAPRTAVNSLRSPLLKELIDDANEIHKVEDRLISLWTSFRIERLALYRDLGELPYNDWPSFYADLSPRPGAAEAVPAVAPAPAPAPPPTPKPGSR